MTKLVIKRNNFVKIVLIVSSLCLPACGDSGNSGNSNELIPDDDTEVREEKVLITDTYLMPINPDSSAANRIVLIQQ